MGLIMEKSGGSRTLGRVFGYLLLADKPRTLDQKASDLLFSKATASLTVRHLEEEPEDGYPEPGEISHWCW